MDGIIANVVRSVLRWVEILPKISPTEFSHGWNHCPSVSKMLLCPSAVRAVGAQVWKMTDMCCRRWIVGWVLMCDAMCLPSFCCVLRLSTKALGARLTMTGTCEGHLHPGIEVTLQLMSRDSLRQTPRCSIGQSERQLKQVCGVWAAIWIFWARLSLVDLAGWARLSFRLLTSVLLVNDKKRKKTDNFHVWQEKCLSH